MTIAAAILTGGKASRIGGIAKGSLPGDGDIPIIQRLIRRITVAGVSAVVLVANDPQSYPFLGKTVIPDLHSGIGRMTGVELAFGGRQKVEND